MLNILVPEVRYFSTEREIYWYLPACQAHPHTPATQLLDIQVPARRYFRYFSTCQHIRRTLTREQLALERPQERDTESNKRACAVNKDQINAAHRYVEREVPDPEIFDPRLPE